MGVQACRLPCFILQPTGTPRPHINGFLWVSKTAGLPALKPLQPVMGVQACHLPCFILHPTGTQGHSSKPFGRPWGGPSLPFAMLHPAANRHPKATHQWLLMGVQTCGGSKPAVCHASSCSQQAPEGDTSMASYGRPSLPFASP